MSYLKITALIAILVGFSGCGGHEVYWQKRTIPTTNEEREAIALHVEKILAATPRELSGHDQDWDDAINAAHIQATVLFCRPTMWEMENNGFGSCFSDTGRWRYTEEIKP